MVSYKGKSAECMENEGGEGGKEDLKKATTKGS
jgi:hypothetical protein